MSRYQLSPRSKFVPSPSLRYLGLAAELSWRDSRRPTCDEGNEQREIRINHGTNPARPVCVV